MPDSTSTSPRPVRPTGGLRPAALALALATAFGALPTGATAQTLPSGGVAVHGQAVITQPAANHLRVVTQNGAGTNHSAINWQSFSISAGSTAAIVQPSASSLSINRVVTNTPSAIFGNLTSNGRLVLVNQSGIAVGAGAVIDTAGFTASALRMTDADALAGRLRFGEPGANMGGAAGLTVGGRITARDGDIVLVAPNVELGTSALLQAPNGSTILAAGQQVEITGRGLEGITMLVQAPTDQARNLGRLEGSAVGIFAGTLRHSGEIQATTATLEGGTVVLKAGGDAFVEGAGTITAIGTRGGSVDVLGARVAVTDHAVIDVSGDSGGGNIRIGGDFQGKNPDVPNALRTYLGPDAQLRADALARGDGGRVILWGDEVTRAYGSISARGGLVAGNGGFSEVSGKHGLVFEARVDLRGPAGLAGTLLLDPDFIDIVNGGSDPATSGDQFADAPSSVSISPAALAAVVGNVMLQSDGDITFTDPVTFATAGKGLTALAGNAIRVDAAISTNGGNILLYSAEPGAAGTGSTDSDAVYVNAPISSNGGAITLRGDSCDLFCDTIVVNSTVNAGAGNIFLIAAGDIRQGVSGALIANSLSATAEQTIDLNQSSNNISGDVSLLTNLGAGGSSLLQFHNSASAFNLSNAVAKGDVNIAAAGSMTTDGSITSGTGNVSINALGGMSLGDDVLAAGTLTLLSNNANIAQTAGGLVAGGATTVNAGTGDVFLPDAGNNFTTVSVAGGNIAVSDDNTMTVTAFTRNVPNANLSFFANGGPLVLPTGDINVGTGAIQLGSAGPFTTPGRLTGSSVEVGGSGGIVFSNDVTVNGGIFQMQAGSGTITQSGGQILAAGGATTVFNAPGVPVVLTAAGNDFGEFFGATGSLSLVDQNNIVVSASGGGISSNTGNITLTATGIGNTTLLGNVNAGAGDVTLNSRSVTQSGGAITAGTLTVNSSLGSVTLNGANTVTAARLSGSGASAIAFNNLATNYALSGSGGALTVTGGGHVTVDQALNFASGIDITSGSGITLAANVTPGANLSLNATTGLIEQTAGVLFANSGTATINAGGGDISLPSATNQFNVVNLAGGHITAVASSGLIVNTLASGLGQNVFLDAGAGALLLPATPINAGAGQITLTSGGGLLLSGALTGSDILISSATGLTIGNNITASGFLNMGSTSGGVLQSGGTSIVVAGPTTVGAGTAAITLAQPGNNFSTVEASGGAITLHDANGLSLGSINANTSLDVVTNGPVTQSAAVLVSGTTSINAGTGNVTLTTAGNNLNVLSVSGNAINVVEGAGSSLTVTSLTSGLNQPVTLTAGHTLTLPNAGIFTGTADLSLTSSIGPLVIPQPLGGNNISLAAAGGITVNNTVNATGNINASVSGDFVTTINQDVIAGGTMALTLAGGLELPAGNQSARLGAGTGQTINAKYVALTVTGSGTSEIFNVAGPQTITTSGQNGNGEGILVRNTGNFNDTADIYNNSGVQTITVNNAAAVRIQGISGAAEIASPGTQVLVIQGASSANALEIGTAGALGYSEIWGGNQSITVGQTGQSGNILIRGAAQDDNGAGIGNESGNQIIKTTGVIELRGGTAPGVGADCISAPGSHGGSCAFIASDTGSQTITAGDIRLFGGTSGSLNNAVVINFAPSGPQLLEITGGGDLLLQAGGGSGSGNRAIVSAAGTSQTVNFLAGGDLQVLAGSVGSAHRAQLVMSNAAGLQTVTGATGITVTAGGSGGGSNIGNRASISSQGSQVIGAGSGGITLTAGGGTGLETDNDAQIFQGGLVGTSQLITVSGGGDIVMQGGTSSLSDVGGATHGSRALIEGDGDAQTITMTGGGDISLTGGSNGSRAFAMIYAGNSATQSITGAGTITLTGGDSGGGIFNAGANFEGNRGVITTVNGSQTIQAANILLIGGTGGQANRAEIFSGGDQTISVSNALQLEGGSGGGGAGSLGNSALVQTTIGNQTISVGAGGLSMTGGSGAAGEINNTALLRLGDNSVARAGKVQMITVNGGGNVTLAGGDTSESTMSTADCGSCAVLRTDGDAQTINFVAGGMLSVTGGAVGIRNHASVFANFGATQTITGASGMALAGGVSGGSVGNGNFAFAGTNSGTQTISVGASGIALQGGGGGTENNAALRQSTSTGSTAGSQSITIGGGGTVVLQGGGGTTNFARVQGFGATQTLNFTSGGSLSLVGGTGTSLDYARVEAVNGNQNVTGSPTITLLGGASGGTDLNGNNASIVANAAGATQTIVSSGMTLSAGGSGINNYAFVGAAVQDLTVHGNLSLVGGGSSPSVDGTQGGGARIGAPGTMATDLTLVVDGALSLTGGSVSGAAIGSGSAGASSTALDITVGGAVALSPGSVSTAGSRIGSPAALPGTGDIDLQAGGTVALLGTVAGETAIQTLGRVNVQGNALDIRNRISGSEVALHGLSGVALSGVASVNASAAGTAIKVIADAGSFSNSAGGGALVAPNGRWLVYSVDPSVDTRGALAYAFKQYDALPVDTVLGTGNGFLYSVAPSVTASLVGVVSKTYDGTDVATLSGANYTATGIDGDTITLNNPATGLYDNKSVGTSKQVTASGLTIVSQFDGVIPVFGYNPVVAPASAAIGAIGSATISAISGITAANKVYDSTQAATLTATGAVFAGLAIGDLLTVTGATGLFDTKDVGTGKTVNISGLVLSGADAGNYTLSSTTATTTADISPASISAITGITAAGKVYDGTTAAALTTTGAAFTGRLGSDVLTVATAVGNFSDKNVGNPKSVNITGLSLGGTDAGNYTLVTTTASTGAAITPATISAVGGITATKVYDGTTTATAVTTGATFTGAIAGDNLTLGVAGASFGDRNVGTGKALTATGLTLGGTDSANYSFVATTATGTGAITQRPLSTWSGAGGDGLWSNPLNWDAIPDGSNVAAVSIPAGAGSVTFDSGVPATSLQTVSSLRPLAMSSGSLSVGATLAADDFSQSGGTLGGAGSLIVSNSFSQTGGSIAMGNITIVQNSGNLSFTNLSGAAVALVAPSGSISQAGPLVATTVSTSSHTGTTLTNSSNQFSNLYAENLGTGAITIVNSAPLNVLGLDNADGNINVSTTGAMSTFGPVTAATGSVLLAANGSGGSLGIFAPVTAGDQVVLAAADTLTQDAAVVGTNGVGADAGLSIVFGPMATASYAPVVYRINGVVAVSPPAELVPVAAEEEEVAPLIIFQELLQAAVAPPPPEPDDFGADGKRKEQTDDTIVTEGEVCK